MNCPVCKEQMVAKDFGGIEVDICENGCKGIWFDWAELIKLDETHEGCGKALNEALKHPRSNDENRGRINCPKCNTPMHIHKYESSKEVNVDECYICGGFFLDSGELNILRKTFIDEEEQEAYNDKLIQDCHPEYQEAELDLEKQKTRIKAIRKYTKYISLSYYMTGR